jgi:hypothetical protein
MTRLNTYYTGQDIAIDVDAVVIDYEDIDEIVVEIFNNDTLVKTCRKSDENVVAMPGYPTCFVAQLLASETTDLVDGYIRVAITVSMPDETFEDGFRDDKYYGSIGKFKKI